MGFVKPTNKNNTGTVDIIDVKAEGGEHQRAKLIRCLIVVIAPIRNLDLTKLSFKLILDHEESKRHYNRR